jgi:hypothetical protein
MIKFLLLKKQTRKNMKPNPGLKRAVSRGSISDKKVSIPQSFV